MDNSKYLFNFQKEIDRINKRFAKKPNFKTLSESIELRKDLIELQRVIDWCSSKKITVLFKNDRNLYLPDEATIIIGRYQTTTRKLITLLHECGHFLIDQSRDRNVKTYNMKYGNGYEFYDDKKKNKTVRHKIDVLSEEIEAWNRGYTLALRLNLNLDKNKFDKEKASAVKTYAFWASH